MMIVMQRDARSRCCGRGRAPCKPRGIAIANYASMDGALQLARAVNDKK